MIIIQLTGGLGNQLFQYAMGRTLALKNNTVLKIDISFFETYEWHEYSLKPFKITAPIADKSEVLDMKSKQNSLIQKFKRRYLNGHPVVIEEKNLLFDPNYMNIKSPAYVMGYWQSEKYFEKYKQQVVDEFELRWQPSNSNLELLTQIKTTDAISLHIRRGNYVSVDFVNKAHGTCSMDYYQESIKLMAANCKKPVFYIFSDDIPWVKENLPIQLPHVFVDINDAKTDYEDLRLMYSCKHHITANSTFSWWGAWLNRSPEKIVIAPKQWFADDAKNKESATIIPEKWIRL